MLFVKEESGRVVATPKDFYPAYLNVIAHQGEITQGALETARLVFTEDLCRTVGKPLHLYIVKDDDFRLSRFPAGNPPKQASGTWYETLPGTPLTRLGISI